MVSELAILRRPAGQRVRPRGRLQRGPSALAAADGHLRHRFVQTMDERDTFLLEVAWRDLEAHVNGFEPSEAHARFMAALEPLLHEQPVVIHVRHGAAA